jgi:hypothetical protein
MLNFKFGGGSNWKGNKMNADKLIACKYPLTKG